MASVLRISITVELEDTHLRHIGKLEDELNKALKPIGDMDGVTVSPLPVHGSIVARRTESGPRKARAKAAAE